MTPTKIDKRLKRVRRVLTHTAKTAILRKYRRLIAYLANSYAASFPDVDVDDLHQEISLGFLRAAELFDATTGTRSGKAIKFSRYATIWAKNYAQREVLWHRKFGMGVPEKRAKDHSVIRLHSCGEKDAQFLANQIVDRDNTAPEHPDENIWGAAELVLRREIGKKARDRSRIVERCVAVFMMKFRDGLTVRKIAAAIGSKNHQIVSQIVRRCLDRLRQSPEFSHMKPEGRL